MEIIPITSLHVEFESSIKKPSQISKIIFPCIPREISMFENWLVRNE